MSVRLGSDVVILDVEDVRLLIGALPHTREFFEHMAQQDVAMRVLEALSRVARDAREGARIGA